MNAERLIQLYDRVSEAPDAVPRLRRFILDLAVRGKLVEQDPEDEPASELVKRLPEEQLRLFQSGKIRKPLLKEVQSLTTLKDAPSNWSVVRGTDLFPTRSGNSKLIKGRLYSAPGPKRYPGYSAAGQDVWLDDWEHEGTAIILSAVGARCGKAFLAAGRWSAIANTHVIWVMPEITAPAYAMLNLNNEDFWVRSGGAQPFVKVRATFEKPFYLPPLAEQHRIVAKIDELMAFCDSLETERKSRQATRNRLTTTSLNRLTASDVDEKQFKAHANFAIKVLPELTTRPDQIKVLRKTILDLAVRGKLVDQDPNDESASDLLPRLKCAKAAAHMAEGLRSRLSIAEPTQANLGFVIPESWTLSCFDDLFVIVSGVTKGQRLNPKDAIDVPYLRVANVQRGHVDLRVVKSIAVKRTDVERYRLQAGDILMTEGGDWDKLGRAALWQGEIPACIHQNHVFRIRPPSDEILPDWAVIYANSPAGRAYFQAASKQTTNLASINMTQLRKCPLPLPPLAEQRRIVARVRDLETVCDRVERTLAIVQEAKEELLGTLLRTAIAESEKVSA